ncbi:hypothetical protein AGDE_08106 [Angomonas deanei]|uniref:Uncharacterized protein n=1 Tax=Angomonas deanei TaxID=59799 RepID=A0A7G2CQH2_9TRYP|nr:hypothetical protein AGDE_08106 [Angomonas deanei]CAD2221224.1 hypothetical protein, conserved [Angomonas deanei]|eukprot:EPY33986.1 hypothetical protein AGDE_08106 [Angomonas deanei]
MVYGSFVDTRCCSLHSLSLPPRSALVFGHCRRPSHTNTNDKETLLKVVWKRAPGVFGGHDGSAKKDLNRPAQAGAAGAKTQKEVLHAHIQQYPEGIHGVNSSPFLRQLLLQGRLPTPEENETEMKAQEEQHKAQFPKTADATMEERGQLHNVSPAPLPEDQLNGQSVQHTIVSANTYNHLSTYFVAHQDGNIVYHTPLQTISASIATRKLTAHCLFMSAREEVNPGSKGSSNDLYYDFFSNGGGDSPLMKSPVLGAAGNNDNPNISRETMHFRDIPLTTDESDVLFATSEDGGAFVDADKAAKTISAGLASFVVEPLLLMGNQNGDLFIFSILQEKVVQRINFNGGSSYATHTSVPASSDGGHVKVVSSQVAAIAEVESGVERKLTNMVEYASVAKRNRKPSFRVAPETDSDTKKVTNSQNNSSTKAFYDVPPSIFAVAFDNGHFLLVCVTATEGYMLSHYNSDAYGLYSIRCISVRVPCFFTRLWTSAYLPGKAPRKAGGLSKPPDLLLVSESMLFVHNEENQIAAIACNGGTIALARLPSMEVLASVSAYEYHAVGNIISLRWAASSAKYLLAPDLLFASGEDDMLTAFQLNCNVLFTANSDIYSTSGNFTPTRNTHGLQLTSAIPMNSSPDMPPAGGEKHSSSTDDSGYFLANVNNNTVAGGLLRILEKKRFHRSWITGIDQIPLVLPAEKTTGMPQHIGVTLLCTSYDNTVSFWPLLFPYGALEEVSSADYAATSNASNRRYYIVEGPTAAHPLDGELTTCTAVAGGGACFFMISLCVGER